MLAALGAGHALDDDARALVKTGDGRIIALDGNSVEIGREILADYAHPLVTVVDTMDAAARKAAELASGN